MKINLTDATLKHLSRLAQAGEANEPAATADRSGNDWEAICFELASPKRDKNGCIDLSRATFDWVVEELSWAFETYWNEAGEK